MMKIAVLGLGKFGMAVALELSRQGAEVLAVDRNRRLIEEAVKDVDHVEGFDATESGVLEGRGIGKMDAVVVSVGSNFEASVLITMHCKALGVPNVCAKALNDEQEKVLYKVGADHVFRPEKSMGVHLAKHLLHASVIDFVELPDGYSLKRMKIDPDWAGQSLADLNLLSSRRLNLVQIIRPQPSPDPDQPPVKVRIPLPDGAMVLEAGDSVDVIGPDKQLEKVTNST